MPEFKCFNKGEKKELKELMNWGIPIRYTFDSIRNKIWKAKEFEEAARNTISPHIKIIMPVHIKKWEHSKKLKNMSGGILNKTFPIPISLNWNEEKTRETGDKILMGLNEKNSR